MRKVPLIGIMVSNKKRKNRLLKIYKPHSRGQIYTFTPSDILWNQQRILGQFYEREGLITNKLFPFPDAIYNCCYNKNSNTIKRLEKYIGKNKCFNRVNHLNKWKIYNFLSQTDLKNHIPDTFLYEQVDVKELLIKYKIMYCKPSYGHKGKGVYQIQLKKNGDMTISLDSVPPKYICRTGDNIHDMLNNLFGGKQYIIQEGVQLKKLNNRYFDFRVLIQKNIKGKWSISNIVSKVTYDPFYNTSIYEEVKDASIILQKLYSFDQMKLIYQKLTKISVQAAKIVESQTGEVGELGIDFGLDEDNKLWVIEINGKPQKSIYKNLDGDEYTKLIYRRPMEYSYFLLSSTKPKR